MLHFLFSHPHMVATGSPKEHTFPNPSPNPTLLHQTIIQVRLKSWKVTGLERVSESAMFLLKWCKTVSEGPMAYTLCPYLHFFTVLTVYNINLIVCMAGLAVV